MSRALREVWCALAWLGFAYGPVGAPLEWVRHTNARQRRESEARAAAQRARYAPPPWHPEARLPEPRLASQDEQG